MEKLAALQGGKTSVEGVTFGKSLLVSRNQPQAGLPPDAVTKVFQASPTALPAYAGAVNEAGGYSIYKVVKVIDAPAPDPAKLAAASTRVGDQIGRELMTAYLASLRSGADVKINQSALDKKPYAPAPQGRRERSRRMCCARRRYCRRSFSPGTCCP
jgi:hypothetical protein